MVYGLGVRGKGLGLRALGLEIRAWGLGVEVTEASPRLCDFIRNILR